MEKEGGLYLHLCNHVTKLMLPLDGSSKLNHNFSDVYIGAPGFACLSSLTTPYSQTSSYTSDHRIIK